jgi:amino acid transporter
MMGAGLYTLLGLASTTAGVWLPVAFLVGGAVTIFSVSSYAKLGAKYPSRGGAAQFLIRCFGDGVIAGGLNVFQFLGWIIAMALYCAGFAGYIRALPPWETPVWSGKAMSLQSMDANQGHVLSEAGAAAMGRVGFVVIGIAALLATASGVNATMFGDANLAYIVAKSGELPSDFSHGVWRGGTLGLLVAAVLGARNFALLMIIIGVVSLVVATIQHRQSMNALRAEYHDVPYSLATIMAALIGLLGILGLLSVIFRQ